MSFAQAAQSIRERFSAEWSRTPIAYPNTPFEKPSGPWIRVTVRGSSAEQVATVSKRLRHEGAVFVQVFTPEGQGDGEALSIADDVAALLEAQTLGGIRFYAATRRPEGVDENGWYMVIVSIPFEYDA